MRYVSFKINNFKGVKSTEIVMPKEKSANVVTLVGLNESGKTTILESIYSHSPDPESKTLFDNKILGPTAIDKIPKNRLYSFTDEVSITATLELSEEEQQEIINEIEKTCKIEFDKSNISKKINIVYKNKFNNSNFISSGSTWSISLRVKSSKAKKWRSATPEEHKKIFEILKQHLPSIAYFPTFLSEIPAKVYLVGYENDERNSFYRKVFQDILDSLSSDITIEGQIVSRLQPAKTFTGTVAESIANFWGSGSRQMVQQVVDKASAKLSKTIVTRWNQMFDNIDSGKEIVIDWNIEEDEERVVPYIWFSIKDGTERFNIAERSLGFRWFFCFLLFTQFRAQRKGSAGTLFLFDEPASNLHAAAQEKLLDSFRDVCSTPNALIYSTHSPYMINPFWLDSAYIVENRALGSDLSDIANMSVSNYNKIDAIRYHDFLELHPNRVSHFQPILDRLEVRPHLMEIKKPTVLVEGKADFTILHELGRIGKVSNVHFVPCHGAQTMDALISLFRGWGNPFMVLLDGDGDGATSKNSYEMTYNIAGKVFTLKCVDESLKSIESLIDDSDKGIIAEGLGKAKANKKDIYRYFADRASISGSYPAQFRTHKSTAFKGLIKKIGDVIGQ